MIHPLTWQTSPGLRRLVCSKCRAVETRAPDNQCGIAISLENDEEREALLAKLEMRFAAQRFSNHAVALKL